MALLVEGQRFERYRVIRWLGSGVAGESYEVENVMLQQKAALKLIHPWATLAEAARRQFFRDMQSICMFRHPYLAEVIDYGEIDAQLYVARRYVSSGSLLSNEGRMLFRPPFLVSDAIRYGSQIAQALEYIHQQHYVHGALTLGNVLVLRGPNREHTLNYAPFLLSDIGLAQFVRRFGQPKLPVMSLTAAPEQLHNQATPITPASDQFSLAVIIYLWLTGRPPYLGSPEEIAHLKLTATIVPPTAFNPQITFQQEGALLRALSVRPEDRYPSMQTFANALMATPPTRSSRPLPPVFARLTKLEESADTNTPSTSTDTPKSPDTTPVEPLPKPEPDIPIPIPEPAPIPEPLPEPAPETAPQPAEPEKPTIEPLPKPEPDIFKPIPETPPAPEPLPQTEPLTDFAAADTNTSLQETAMQEQEQDELETKIAYFIIASPFSKGTSEVILERDELTIGRAGSSDILLDFDDKTSRHHALLRREEGQYVLYDRQSAFGVFVNDEQIAANQGHILVDGDYICIGNYELIFLVSEPADTGSTPTTATTAKS